LAQIAVIPSKSNRKTKRLYDRELYKAQHLIENFFCKLPLFADEKKQLTEAVSF